MSHIRTISLAEHAKHDTTHIDISHYKKSDLVTVELAQEQGGGSSVSVGFLFFEVPNEAAIKIVEELLSTLKSLKPQKAEKLPVCKCKGFYQPADCPVHGVK
jgi:hypothetical protein